MKSKINLFKKNILKIVRNIPKGKIMTYGEVAKRAGEPRAARAVGTYMRLNFDRNIPCHRVIRSNGALGNYNRGGTKKKRNLLKKEGYFD